MTCEQVNQFLAAYVDGTLPWRQRLAFRVHLLLCRDCRRYLASYLATIRAAQTLGGADQCPAEAAPEELVRAIMSAQRGAIRIRRESSDE